MSRKQIYEATERIIEKLNKEDAYVITTLLQISQSDKHIIGYNERTIKNLKTQLGIKTD